MEFPENPAVNMDQLPLLQDVDVLPVDRAYRKMRLLAWGVVQALILVAVLAPFAGQLLGWLEGVNMGLIWIPLLVQFALGGLWFAEEWLGFERRGVCGSRKGHHLSDWMAGAEYGDHSLFHDSAL